MIGDTDIVQDGNNSKLLQGGTRDCEDDECVAIERKRLLYYYAVKASRRKLLRALKNSFCWAGEFKVYKQHGASYTLS
jgi:hypothetical protein